MKEKLITIFLTILILVVPIAILPSEKENYSVIKIVLLVVLSTILFILLLINYKKLTIDKTDILAIIFAVLVFASTMFSSDIKTSIFGAYRRYEGMLAYFSYIIIYFCAKKFLNYKNSNTLLNVAYILFITVSILGVLQYYISIPSLYPIFSKGICGTFGNTNFIGSFISLGIPVFMILYIFKGFKLSYITSILLFFCLIACHARSLWVAFAGILVIIIAYLIKNKKKEYLKRTLILFISFIAITAYIYANPNSEFKNSLNIISKELKLAKKNGIQPEMGSMRIQIWQITLGVIKQKPILGVGTDNLARGIAESNTKESIEFIEEWNSIFDKAHNEYLQIMATIGIPALIVYLTFIGNILFKKRKKFFNNLSTFAVVNSILCYMVQAFFNISTVGIAPLFWFMLGLLDSYDSDPNLNKVGQIQLDEQK